MKMFISILILLLFGCSSPINENETIKDESDSISGIENTEIEELIKKWTWNDKIVKPSKSSISSTKISSDLLFKTWTWSDGDENDSVFTFHRDYLTIHDENNYIYTINQDSLRIFTSYGEPGDGFTRGIITKLTKDSLIIMWSTDDVNEYVPIKSK